MTALKNSNLVILVWWCSYCIPHILE